ncbi:MAG: CHASE2 domain-containing protein [Deltaproteobacteria bacterium]|nr:CHASE2 domain-containing protein [Deltaproteobacteria bacterium]
MAAKDKKSGSCDFGPFIGNKRSESRHILIWGILSTLLLGLLFVFYPSLLQPFEWLYHDLLLKRFPGNRAGDRLVIVDLDEKSLNRYGQWPWPRYRVAELFSRINAMQPAVIGIDALFPEPDHTSAVPVVKEPGGAFRLAPDLDRLPRPLTNNDLFLAEVLGQGPFVLGNKFHFNTFEKSSETCVLHPVKVSTLSQGGKGEGNLRLPEGEGVLCNLPVLAERAQASGFLNFSPDPDGMMRRLPLLIQYQGEVFTGLGLAMVMKLQGIDHLILKMEANRLHAVHYKDTSIPVDRFGQLLVKFRGLQRSFQYVSAADILAGQVSAERLRGRLVLFGASASSLRELRTTPFDPIFPGVEAHATVIDNLLAGDFISVPAWSTGLVLLLILTLGLLLSTAIAFFPASICFLTLVLSTMGLALLTRQAFYGMGFFIGTAYPIAALVVIYLFLTLLKFRLEEKKVLYGMRELLLTQDRTIETMASLTEYRSHETGDHINRTKRYIKLLAERARHRKKYKPLLTDSYIDLLVKAASLHDIGKVVTPDNILLKPGPLNSDELETMRAHTVIGRDVLQSSTHKLGNHYFLTMAAEIAYTHHEKWDGSGYPQGLQGEAIPVSGRLMALVDVYDALTSKRVYKKNLSHEVAFDYIKNSKGSHFDPDLVDAFLEIHEQFRDIAQDFGDS